jgi:hypothetical protein
VEESVTTFETGVKPTAPEAQARVKPITAPKACEVKEPQGSLEDRVTRLELQNRALEVEITNMKQAFRLIFASANAMMTAEKVFLK